LDLVNAPAVVSAVWIGLLVFWLIAAVTAKQTARRQSGPARLGHLVLLLVGWHLLTHRRPELEWLNDRFVPDMPVVAWAGVALALAGAAFAVWARLTIGRNWSGTITVKKDHELMTRGPYAIVRHPIYSGLLLTLAGTALVVGEWRAIVALGLAFAGWRWKSLMEERVMTEQFGPAYEDYKRRVKALIPFVW
jgi:protein-S-isoprenylcysteine O-methyltransferase Ste14